MKLLFIHDHPFYQEQNYIYSGGGLPARVWNNYLSSFEKIEVIGRKSNNTRDKQVLSSNDNYVTFYLIERYSSINALFFNFRKIKKTIESRILLNEIIILRLPSILGFIAGYICTRKKIPFVVEQVGNAREALSSYKSFLGKIIAPIFHSYNKKLVRKAPYVIYVTKKKLQKDYPTKGKTESISNVIIPTILSVDLVEDFRFTEKKMKIALIGGFDAKYKGQDILLRAIFLLPTSVRENIELYFIGKGDYKWIELLSEELCLKNNIKFIGGLQAGNEIFNMLQQMSLYVQPSFTEGMPRAMLEGMSMGCPVLASNVGGIPDILENEMLHKPGDFQRLSSQILSFYNNRNLLIEESEKNLKRVLPYLKDNLDKKRKAFFELMIKEIGNENKT